MTHGHIEATSLQIPSIFPTVISMYRTPHAARPLALLLITLLALASPSPADAAIVPDASGTPTLVTGWASAPTKARPGQVYVARVRVPGGARPVQLQRRVDSGWRTVEVARSSSDGAVALRWKAPRRTTRVTLRVNVPPSGDRPGVTTRPRPVQVRRTLGGALQALLNPLLQNVLSLVNDARSQGHTCGSVRYPAVPALRVDSRLNDAAVKYARLMAERDFFSHTGLNGSDPGDRIDAEGYDWHTYGENIAGGQRSAAEVVEDWLESEGHCKNLMNRGFKEIGLGYAYDAGSTYGHYWVQEFGAER